MDKWKDMELEKMKAGGNGKAREFFESQPDFRPDWSIQEKYNSKAAALLKDKIATEADGKSWSYERSPARNFQPPLLAAAGGGMVVYNAIHKIKPLHFYLSRNFTLWKACRTRMSLSRILQKQFKCKTYQPIF
jgi:hypothetical protein